MTTFKGNSFLVPQEITDAILLRGYETSIIGRLSGNTPISVGTTNDVIYKGKAQLGQAAEATAIGTSNVSADYVSYSPIKVGTIIPVSREFADRNPAKLMDQIQDDMANAVSEALDALILGGKDGKGLAVAGQSNVNQTANRIELVNGDYETALEAGLELIYGTRGKVTGIAFDPIHRIKLAKLANATNTGMANLATSAFNLHGFRAEESEALGNLSQGLVLGDWSKVKAGFAEDVRFEVDRSATVGGVSMFETDQVALKITATIGGVVLDPTSFVVIEDVVAG